MKFLTFTALVASATAMDEYYPSEINNDDLSMLPDCNSNSDCSEQFWPIGVSMTEFVSYGEGACISFERLGESFSKCLPSCLCGANLLAGGSPGAWEWTTYQCEGFEDGDYCNSVYEANADAFMTCMDKSDCREGEMCGMIPQMDWGVLEQRMPGETLINTSKCIYKEECGQEATLYGIPAYGQYWKCDMNDWDSAAKVVASVATLAAAATTLF